MSILLENFKTRKQLLTMKTKSLDAFMQIKALIFLGIPSDSRLTAWEKILDVENLVNITLDKLIMIVQQSNENLTFLKNLDNKTTEGKKKELYKFLFFNTKTKYSVVDYDINNLKFASEAKRNQSFQSVRNISKCYLIWTELNIMTDIFSLSENKGQKFVYFFGLLQIIHRFIPVFKDDYKIFWIICSFSQYFEMFYQNNPLFENQSSFMNIYTLIIKVRIFNN